MDRSKTTRSFQQGWEASGARDVLRPPEKQSWLWYVNMEDLYSVRVYDTSKPIRCSDSIYFQLKVQGSFTGVTNIQKWSPDV